ncbi:hypothetical protein M1E17_09485 [Arthrobacter sp. D1-29]
MSLPFNQEQDHELTDPTGAASDAVTSCEERDCPRLSSFESTAQVPRRARSTMRLRDHVVDAVIRLGQAVSETAAAFRVSWWLVRAAVNEACLLSLPGVDELSLRMLGIDDVGDGRKVSHCDG